MKHDWTPNKKARWQECVRCGVVLVEGGEEKECPGYPPPPEKIMVGRFKYIRADLVTD